MFNNDAHAQLSVLRLRKSSISYSIQHESHYLAFQWRGGERVDVCALAIWTSSAVFRAAELPGYIVIGI